MMSSSRHNKHFKSIIHLSVCQLFVLVRLAKLYLAHTYWVELWYIWSSNYGQILVIRIVHHFKQLSKYFQCNYRCWSKSKFFLYQKFFRAKQILSKASYRKYIFFSSRISIGSEYEKHMKDAATEPDPLSPRFHAYARHSIDIDW